MFGIAIKNVLLLTGAGFTKNFGGFLALEMWEEIFNTKWIRESPKLRSLLLENEDFESVYSKVLDEEGFSPDDKERMKKAVRDAYRSLDNAIKSRNRSGNPYISNVMKLVNLFGGNSSQRGLVFTLNQDLWLERQVGVNCLGVDGFARPLYDRHDEEVSPDEFIKISVDGAPERARAHSGDRGGLIYLKLHGSYAWTSAENPDQMIIGTRKEKMIKEHPLFSWYFEAFKWAIARGNQKLLVIGYGFRDEHINRLLLEGVEQHALKLYVLTTTRLHQLRHEMTYGQAFARPLLAGIHGYYPRSLSEIFPGDQRETDHARRLFADLQD